MLQGGCPVRAQVSSAAQGAPAAAPVRVVERGSGLHELTFHLDTVCLVRSHNHGSTLGLQLSSSLQHCDDWLVYLPKHAAGVLPWVTCVLTELRAPEGCIAVQIQAPVGCSLRMSLAYLCSTLTHKPDTSCELSSCTLPLAGWAVYHQRRHCGRGGQRCFGAGQLRSRAALPGDVRL